MDAVALRRRLDPASLPFETTADVEPLATLVGQPRAADGITFEQSYGGVDGDSASSTELYALLSAVADLPPDQGIAVTGSVDQHGGVQAVGGVTDKIEGFFRFCRDRGLTGSQGVAIPAADLPHLMLSDEVVRAVEEGRFHVWALRTIDEGIELLTRVPAGERQEDGTYPAGTVHRLAQDRLRGYVERSSALAQADGQKAGAAAAPDAE